jgi:hypothetical protein
MGNKTSSNKKPYNELLNPQSGFTELNLNSRNKNANNDINIELLSMEEDQKKMMIEINHLKEKNQKLEAEVNKIQTNYGQEIFNLLEYCSVLQKDIENMMNNQRIISEFLQTNSRN